MEKGAVWVHPRPTFDNFVCPQQIGIKEIKTSVMASITKGHVRYNIFKKPLDFFYILLGCGLQQEVEFFMPGPPILYSHDKHA